MRKLLYITITLLIGAITWGCSPTDAPSVYNLTTNVTPGEGGTISPASGEFEAGSEVEIKAEASEGYIFDGWKGDLSGSNNPATITIEDDQTITAVFKLKEYALNIDVDGEGGVTEEIVEEKSKDYEHGTTVRLTAEPAENWAFDSWEGDLSGSENPATVTVEEAKSVTAVFKLQTHALNLTIEGEGEVTAEPDKTEFESGEEVTLTAEPADGWRFAEWKGDITESENPISFAFGSDMNVTSVFMEIAKPLMGMGYNHNGQVAGNNTQEPDPILIAYEIESVDGGDWHTLYIDKDGVLWGLGYNGSGQLGNGTTTDGHEPVQIATDVVEVAAGGNHSLFVKSDGTLWAMGENEMGQLGDGTTTNRLEPVQIDNNVENVTAGQHHSLYIKTDGTLWAMGNNNDGQLGDNTTTSHENPVQVASDVDQIAAGGRHTLYTTTDGTLWAMGGNGSGQLGDGTRTSRSTPVEVTSDVSTIAAGRDHSLFIKTDDMLWAMGNNERGQLGDGTQENRFSPIEIESGVVSTKAGNRHTLLIKTDGTLWAMGKNSDGQLGDGTTTDSHEPIQIDSEVTDIAAGVHHSLYIKD